MKILIDDFRDIPGMDIILRNSDAVYTMVKGIIDLRVDVELYMDHDLGENSDDGCIVIRNLLSYNFRPEFVSIVSSNPVGRDNIAHALIDTGDYIQKAPHFLVRKEVLK